MKKTTVFLITMIYNELKEKVQSKKVQKFHLSDDYADSDMMWV